MKLKLVSLIIVASCLLAAQSLFAVPTYWMQTGGNYGSGQIFTGSDAASELNAAAANVPDFTGVSAPSGSWDVAGYWTFTVTNSTTNTPGSNWNEVFAGGTYFFDITWNGSVMAATGAPVTMPAASFHQWATWDQIYGDWFRNNDGVYTYFKLLNCDPATSCASDGSLIPTGVFAFVLDTQGGGNYGDFAGLKALGDPRIYNGTGIATASVPEPGTMVLLGIGLAGIAGLKLRKRT